MVTNLSSKFEKNLKDKVSLFKFSGWIHMELPILADRIGVVENDDSEAERAKMN